MHAQNKLPPMHCHTALCTHIHTQLAIHAPQDNHMQTQTHSANQACTHKTTGYTYTVAQLCASTYTHIWLSMHNTTTPCKHKHTQIHGYAIQINIHALPHSTVHAHKHTSGYPCTTTQHCARTYTHIWLSMHCNTALCMHKLHIWLSMHCHTALCTHIRTHLAIHALQDKSMHTQTHPDTHACKHTNEQLVAHALPNSTVHTKYTHLAIHAL